MGEILHEILDKLEGALANIRKTAAADFGPVDAVVGELRQHADQQAAALEHAAAADGESAVHDAETAAEPVVAEAKTDVDELGHTVVADVQTDVADATAAAPTETEATEPPAAQTAA